MEITTYTLELSNSEMFDLAYALENSIENMITLGADKKHDLIFNDFEDELKLLGTFCRDFGYVMSVHHRTEDGRGWDWGKDDKDYSSAEEWFTTLLKQRRKEYDSKNTTTK
jgi:hypothetical protein